MRMLIATSLLAATAAFSPAAFAQQSCQADAQMARSFAEDRDAGKPIDYEIRKMEFFGKVTHHEDAADHLIRIVRTVYKFKQVSPDDMANMVLSACMQDGD